MFEMPPTQRSSGFFFPHPILWCSHIGNHPQEEIAKFDYRSKMKVENFKNPDFFGWPDWFRGDSWID
jgi:hypothetical protein